MPLEVLGDTIQPFPTFSEIYIAALNSLHNEIAAALEPAAHSTPAFAQQVQQ